MCNTPPQVVPQNTWRWEPLILKEKIDKNIKKSNVHYYDEFYTNITKNRFYPIIPDFYDISLTKTKVVPLSFSSTLRTFKFNFEIINFDKTKGYYHGFISKYIIAIGNYKVKSLFFLGDHRPKMGKYQDWNRKFQHCRALISFTLYTNS